MNFRLLAQKIRDALIQSRASSISRSASFLTFALITMGLVASTTTNFALTSLPNVLPLVIGVVCWDLGSQFVPQTKIVEAVRTFLYGFLYLVTTIISGVVAAYSMQRIAFPLQDQFLASIDTALGLDWAGYAHWVDRHPLVQQIFLLAYDSIKIQIALPLIVLSFSNRLSEVRAYLLAFAIAFILTISISALMPAAGPIAFVDRSSFNVLQFTGATPLDHLMRLREAGPMTLSDTPGGIATFPSFHATVAVLTPLVLRRYRRIFIALLVLNSAMLAGTVTEGAHYFIDILAGSGMALFAYWLAIRIIPIEDRSLSQQGTQSNGGAVSQIIPATARPATEASAF